MASSHANAVVTSAQYHFKQWKEAQSWSSKALFPNHFEGDGADIWVKLQTDTIKVTADAAIFAEQDVYGFGLIARDNTGESWFVPELVSSKAGFQVNMQKSWQ